ncbi:MAG: DUF1002 domain-containing protein [Tissierellia bacterium]|nr:DUF1002 domain-containing protein [Tissierellia bacterium]
MKGKITALFLAFLFVVAALGPVYAQAQEGDVIVVLGQDLSEADKDKLRENFGVTKETPTVEVTNAEEYQYLGNYMPAEKIGSQALSSARLRYLAKGSGIHVETSDKIRYITPAMYKNALATAGVEDVEVYVDCTMNVSGSAALTGLLKAHEASTGQPISEDIKQVANEELVVTSSLSDSIGAQEAADLIETAKVAIAENAPKTKEEVRSIVINVAGDLNINLSPDQEDQVVNFLDGLRQVDIDWAAVKDQAGDLVGQAKDYLSSEEGQSFLAGLRDAINSFFDWLMGLFN